MVKDSPQLVLHAQLYQLADKYFISGFKELITKKFTPMAKIYWDTKVFLEAADIVCATTMDTDLGLRKTVVDVLDEHVELLGSKLVQKLLQENGDIGLKLLQLKAELTGWYRIID
ncbi:hypothetical protein P280DRAFT_524373 [Massarina eburnea CBS 473.64]|uniref:BTB domain-containing protein n=1 Tax=Massarina eburnea CBS 473.64 TaxID=1395130 RepID=A0A6A6RGB0_9PLEO|nr:hypothetical protein P280DRAFT_524373 [Massarina eburnea CBS 473.64]